MSRSTMVTVKNFGNKTEFVYGSGSIGENLGLKLNEPVTLSFFDDDAEGPISRILDQLPEQHLVIVLLMKNLNPGFDLDDMREDPNFERFKNDWSLTVVMHD